MGYKGYRVANRVIEEVLVRGWEFKGHVELQEGPPPGSRLARVDFDVVRGVTILWFSHESFESGIAQDDGNFIIKRYYDPI